MLQFKRKKLGAVNPSFIHTYIYIVIECSFNICCFLKRKGYNSVCSIIWTTPGRIHKKEVTLIATKDGLSSLLLEKDGKEPFHYVSFESQGIKSLLGGGD